MPTTETSTGLPMEPDGGQRELVGEAVLDFLDRFEESRGVAQASSPPADAELVEQLLSAPPEEDVAIESLLGLLDQAVDTGFNTSSPGFLSYIPTGGLYTSSLGSFLGAGTNQYTGGSHASPGAVAIEQSIVEWMCSLFGLPEGSGGVLFSGGSIANLTAVGRLDHNSARTSTMVSSIHLRDHTTRSRRRHVLPVSAQIVFVWFRRMRTCASMSSTWSKRWGLMKQPGCVR